MNNLQGHPPWIWAKSPFPYLLCLCSKVIVRVVCAYLSSLTLGIIYRESDNLDEDGGGSNNKNGKRQLKLSNVGFTTSKRSEEIESSGKGRCRFFQARKLEHLTYF